MNILFLTTVKGRNKFTKRLCKAAKSLGHKGYSYYCTSLDKAFANHPEWTPDNLVIHARAANPNAVWMKNLKTYEQKGYRVINSTDVLRLTSDKWESIKRLTQIGNLPTTFLYDKETGIYTGIDGVSVPPDEVQRQLLDNLEYFIIKPRISQGQGAHVHKLYSKAFGIPKIYDAVPGRFVIVQRLIDYTGIYRVFCFNGKSAPKVTCDVPSADDWKVSVCLNRLQRAYNSNVVDDVVELAEKIQLQIGGVINFIDLFVTADNRIVLSEVNTACNLNIHTKLTGINFPKMIVEAILDHTKKYQ